MRLPVVVPASSPSLGIAPGGDARVFYGLVFARWPIVCWVVYCDRLGIRLGVYISVFVLGFAPSVLVFLLSLALALRSSYSAVLPVVTDVRDLIVVGSLRDFVYVDFVWI